MQPFQQELKDKIKLAESFIASMRKSQDYISDDHECQDETDSLKKLLESIQGFKDNEKIIAEMLEGNVKVNVNLNEKLIYKVLFDELNLYVGIGKNVIIHDEKLNQPISDIEVELQKKI